MALGGATAYGFNITFSQIAAGAGISGPSLVLYRVLVMLVLATVATAVLRQSLRVPRDQRGLMLALGAASSGVGLCYLSSVAFIPVAVAAVIFYTYPVLVVLASPFVEGRRLGPALIGIVAMAFAGVVLVVGPGWNDLHPVGLLLAAGASASAAVQFFVATRVSGIGTWPKLFWIHMIVLPASFVAALLTGGLASPGALANAPWSVFLNIAGFIVGFSLQLLALSRISAVPASLAFCVEPVVAALTAALVVGERLGPLQYAGGGLVLAAIVANILADRGTERREAAMAADTAP